MSICEFHDEDDVCVHCLMDERDEARAEVERLRKVVGVTPCEACWTAWLEPDGSCLHCAMVAEVERLREEQTKNRRTARRMVQALTARADGLEGEVEWLRAWVKQFADWEKQGGTP